MDATEITTLVARLMVKTFYGHTMGEVLTLAVALERGVDEVIASQLGGSQWAQQALSDQLLGHVPRDQKAKILQAILRHLDDPDAESTAAAVNGVYKLRDRLAHSALVADGLDDQGWTVETRRRGVERSHHIPVDEVTKIVENGQSALASLLALLEESQLDGPA